MKLAVNLLAACAVALAINAPLLHADASIQGRISSSAPMLSSTASNDGSDASTVNLSDSPFADYTDYATWTQYLCEQLLRSGDMFGLETALSRLNQLAAKMDEDESQGVRNAYWRFQNRVDSWRKQFPDLPSPSRTQRRLDPTLSSLNQAANEQVDSMTDAEIIFGRLLRGHLCTAKRQLKSLMDQIDYLQFDNALKSVMVTVGLVQWDGMNTAQSLLPIWSPEWSLTTDEKISALIRAKQLRRRAGSMPDAEPQNALAFRPFPRIALVDARVLANMGRDVTGMFDIQGIRDSTAEQDMLRAAMSAAQGEFCIARDLMLAASRDIQVGWIAKELKAASQRLNEKCKRKRQEATYRAFCQIGEHSALPLSEAVDSDGDREIAAKVAMHERMFWTRLAVGDCDFVDHNLKELRRIVPYTVISQRNYLGKRFAFMSQKAEACVKTPGLYINNYGNRLMELLRQGEYGEAVMLWRENFDSDSRSPTALLWRTAIVISRYPKLTFAPCMGNSLLSGTRNNREDMELLDRVFSIMIGAPTEACMQSNPLDRDQCNLRWMKAYYVVGDNKQVAQYAASINNSPEFMQEAYNLHACTKLCTASTSANEACRAINYYESMNAVQKRLPQNAIGEDLARQMCRDKDHPMVIDCFYLRDGPLPRPMTAIFKDYYERVMQKGVCPTPLKARIINDAAPVETVQDVSKIVEDLEASALAPKTFRLPFTPNSANVARSWDASRQDSTHGRFNQWMRAQQMQNAASLASGSRAARVAANQQRDNINADDQDAVRGDGNRAVVASAAQNVRSGSKKNVAAAAAHDETCLAGLVQRFPFLRQFIPDAAHPNRPHITLRDRQKLYDLLGQMQSDCERNVITDLMKQP